MKVITLKQIVAKRLALRITQGEMAQAMEVTRGTWSNYETEATNIPLELANKAWQFLGKFEKQMNR